MKLSESDKAVQIAQRLRAAQEIKNNMSLQMGRDGSEAKKMGKDFLRANDVDSWKAYCAHDGLNYSTFNTYVRLYGTYGPDGIGITDEQWLAIGPRKLEILSPIIWKYTDAWCENEMNEQTKELLEKAATVSVSDLIKEIKGEKGDSGDSQMVAQYRQTAESQVPDLRDRTSSDSLGPLSPAKYKSIVKSAESCIICHDTTRDVEYCHWPRTSVHGTFGLPLCRPCHNEMDTFMVEGHVGTRGKWFSMNFRQIGEWLDEIIGG